jgi:chromosome partitioning protein
MCSRGSMAKTVALINMKGGVGKSTIAVNLAWQLSGIQGQDNNVLVVDLDPQFNASQYLLGAQGYSEKIVEPKHATIWDVLEQQTRTPRSGTPRVLNPEDAIVTVREWPENRLDLLPSTLELAWSLKQPAQKEWLLAKFLKKVNEKYNLIIIDCAPTESLLTTGAYIASDYVIVPVKPEYLSTIGLPLLARSLDDFHQQYDDQKVEMLGIVFNHATQYEPEEAISKREVRSEADRFGWDIFKSEISYSRSYPKGAREGQPIFHTSYAQAKQKIKFSAFAYEFANKLGL